MNSNSIDHKKTLENESKKLKIIFVDSTTAFDELKQKIKEFELVKIIAFDYKSRKKLLKNNIDHITSDEFLNDDDLELIQKNTYDLSNWFDKPEIRSELIYENINIGNLFHEQFAEFLVRFLKKYREINNIYKKNPDSIFLASGTLYDIVSSFSNSSKKIKENIQETNFVFDKVRVDFKLGNHYFMILISRNFYLKLKKLSEILINFIFGPKKIINKKSALLVEINTNRYKEIFSKSKNSSLNLFFYGRRRPAIWDFETYKIFKKSNCKIITSIVLKNKKFEINKNTKILDLKKQIKKMWKNEEFFSKFFSRKGVCSWSIIKPTLMDLINNRIEEVVNETELAKNLFKKFNFNSVVVFHEVGLTEQIIISQAKNKGIPIVLLQQGLYHDTEEAKIANQTMTVYPKNADKFGVWGELTKQDALKTAKLSVNKIEVIGAPRYDNIETNIENKEEYVLLAAQGPAYNYVQGHQIMNFEKYEKNISEICKIVLNQNKKLIIKLHPSPKEFDITQLVKKISPKIQVVTTGDIIQLINSCSVMIAVSVSTSILEAQLLHKPVIVIPIIDYKLGIPEIFRDNACNVCNLENFEDKLKKILNSDKDKQEIVQKGNSFLKKYFSNKNQASEKFIELLKTL
jgi:hypothetical protein